MWHKTFLVRAMVRGYHGILVGLEAIPSDDAKPKETIQQLQNEHKRVFRSTTMLYSRHCILWNCGHGKRQGSNEQQYGAGMEMTVRKVHWM